MIVLFNLHVRVKRAHNLLLVLLLRDFPFVQSVGVRHRLQFLVFRNSLLNAVLKLKRLLLPFVLLLLKLFSKLLFIVDVDFLYNHKVAPFEVVV